ncbi:hypothetical protein AMATHDRAFT_74154 [Amanita thiersii Skay4041]|uniref:PIN domain-containing protein n=1 Tax=Amanita thiersii Skay4041 TaxID=703135 RepID=A0A2A9NSP0_9AGAR|nr:hypothetical protein AMATHDRAFT_74154 [Amanita thiersii Skay4041]
MHLDTIPYEQAVRSSRKGKERETSHKELPQKEPQPTDLDEKIMALRRRNAGPLRSREKPERERERLNGLIIQNTPVSSSSRPDRSPKAPTVSLASRPSPASRRTTSPNFTRQVDADHEDFSRRLKISAPAIHSRPPQSQSKSSHNSKLYNPDTDPVPIRCTTEPESDSDGLHVPRTAINGTSILAGGHHREDRGASQRQLFDFRKDDPVKFSASSRPQPPSQTRPIPTPKSSGDYVSASSTSSYAPSVASSITLSSTTDSSTSSALFDSQGQTHEQSSSNAFSTQLKLLYREITGLENKIKQEDSQDEVDDGPEARVMIRGRETESDDIEKERWKRRIADHKKLADTIHELLIISLSPSVPASLRHIPTKYNIIVRLWTYAFHKLLESLRRASFTSPVALEHLQDLIYYAYSFYTSLLEDTTLQSFKNGWLEALGDLARYRMAVAAMMTGGVSGSGNTILTSKAIYDAGISGGREPASSVNSLQPPTTAAAAFMAIRTDTEAHLVKIDNSSSPSVGIAAARLLEIEPEKERWRGIAREWYAAGLAEHPGTGKLHHHLGLLSREVEGEELRGVYHFVKSMTALHPFSTARESVLPIWSRPAQARRYLPDARVPELFVLLHGMLFTNIQLDDFQPVLARFIERLELDGSEEREWIMMAIVNIGAVLEYGKPGGVLRRAGGIASREGDITGTQSQQTAVKVVTRKNVGSLPSIASPHTPSVDHMEVDEDQQIPRELKASPFSAAEQTHKTSVNIRSSATDVLNHAELPTSFLLALQLTFSMLTHVLRHPLLKSSAFAHADVNPYLTVVLTFLVTILKHPTTLQIIEKAVPWEELATFFAKIPRNSMSKNSLLSSPPAQQVPSTANEPGRWAMLTTGCSPALPEDWCIRGMEWVGRKVFERGYWKADPTGDERRTEVDILDRGDFVEGTDGKIEDDDDPRIDKTSTSADRQTYPIQRSGMRQVERRWVRILRCAIGIADVVNGFTWICGTKEWLVQGTLLEKVGKWREQDRLEREEEEKRRMKHRRTDDLMDIDDGEVGVSEEESDDENESDEVKDLKSRRRYLLSLLETEQRDASSFPPANKTRPSKNATPRPPLRITPGYTVLVIDTNILLSSLPMFSSLVESLQWTVVVPLPVIMELDGLASNASPLGEAAKSAITYIGSHLRSHSLSLKVQTSKGNYLANLAVRTEQVDFGYGRPELDRNMDDLILKAAIWQDDHWVDRSVILDPKVDHHPPLDAVKVVLLSLDRNLRVKARARQLPAASERDLAHVLANGT